MAVTRWGGLRPEPYDPDAVDADGDGIVQEGTAWERPGNTRLVDKLGRDIRKGLTSPTRPEGMKVVGRDGKEVSYKPTYGDMPQVDTGKPTPLAERGYRSLREMGLPTIQSIVTPPPKASPTTTPVVKEPYRSPLTTSTAMAKPEDLQRFITEFNALPDDQPVIVFHGTTEEFAEAIRNSLMADFIRRGDDVSGVTKGRGMYVAATPQDAQMYVGREGGEVLAITVPKGALVVPPEMTTDGATPGYALYNPSAGALIPEGTPLTVADKPEPEADWVPRWNEVVEALDMEYIRSLLRSRDEDDDDAVLAEFYQRTHDAWEQWNSCRATRKAAYQAAGIDVSPADANIDRRGGYFGNGWETSFSEDEADEMARYLMATLVQDVQSGPGWENQTLYRAVDVSAKDEEAFWEAMQPGKVIDVPLWSFMDRRNQGPNELLTRYGSDVLIQVDGKPHSVEMGIIGGFYDADSERETLDRLGDLVETLTEERDAIDKEAGFDQQYEWDSIDGTINEIKTLLAQYPKEKDRDKRAKIREDLGDLLDLYSGGIPPARWEGESIDEDKDTEMYYEALEDPWSNRALTPLERLSGGRFEVIAVEDDPEGVYGSIVRLKQTGVFDPEAPGQVVKVKQ